MIRIRLNPNAEIVAMPDFESGIIKISSKEINDLTVDENLVISKLKLSPSKEEDPKIIWNYC